MSSAAAMPAPDRGPVWHNRREAQLMQMNQPLLEESAPHRQRGSLEGSGTRMAGVDGTRSCTHWPHGGVERIRATARLLRGVAECLAHEDLIETPAVRYTGCIDLDSLFSEPTGDTLIQRLAALLAQVQTHNRALRNLADDFATVSRWLATTAESNWEAARRMRLLPGLAAAMGESQRLISKDSFSADANALIATMLRRAVKLLERLALDAGEVNVDTAHQHMGVQVLVPAAELLDSTAVLADNAASSVEEFDQRWHQMRHQAAHAVASTASPAASPEPR